MRSDSRGVMPATGSSISSSSGSWAMTMPSSSHCFSPCASSAGLRCALARQADRVQNLVDAVVPSGSNAASSVASTPRWPWAPAQVFQHGQAFEDIGRLEFAADAEPGDLLLRQPRDLRLPLNWIRPCRSSAASCR